MTNRQAAKLRAGERVRRKAVEDDGTVYIVERIERVPRINGVDIAVHAGGAILMAWEIERYDPPQGWPNPLSPLSMEGYVTLPALAARLAIQTSSLRVAIQRGSLGAVKIDGIWFVADWEADRYVREYTRKPGPRPKKGTDD